MCICILAGMITGCNASEQKETEARTKKEITIAVNSETGGMDPAGNIALTYLPLLGSSARTMVFLKSAEVTGVPSDQQAPSLK